MKLMQTSVVPEFVDETNLPRLVAFIQESLRWRPVSIGGSEPSHTIWKVIMFHTHLLQLGFPHRATQDVIYVSCDDTGLLVLKMNGHGRMGTAYHAAPLL